MRQIDQFSVCGFFLDDPSFEEVFPGLQGPDTASQEFQPIVPTPRSVRMGRQAVSTSRVIPNRQREAALSASER